MTTWPGKLPIAVVTACMNAAGMPTFTVHEVEVTHDEYENGIHYDLVEVHLKDSGYDEPYVHFDHFEGPAFLHPAVRVYLSNEPAPIAHVIPVETP